MSMVTVHKGQQVAYLLPSHISILVGLRKSKICITLAVISKILSVYDSASEVVPTCLLSLIGSVCATWVNLTISLILKQQIASFFMDTINSSHSYATGGTSAGEFWYNF